MCLAVPARIITRHGSDAVVDLHGNQIKVSTALVPAACVGDWVLVHAGFAIQQLDEVDVRETFAVLADMKAAQSASEVCT